MFKGQSLNHDTQYIVHITLELRKILSVALVYKTVDCRRPTNDCGSNLKITNSFPSSAKLVLQKTLYTHYPTINMNRLVIIIIYTYLKNYFVIVKVYCVLLTVLVPSEYLWDLGENTRVYYNIQNIIDKTRLSFKLVLL